jgi:DNA-binding NtrC family response regulator
LNLQASLSLLLEIQLKLGGLATFTLERRNTAVFGGAMKAILFVDDHEVLARLSCEILEMQGYRAVSAYNADQALEKLDQEKFDVLVTDFRMEGMDGLQLARKIHAKDPSLPVIIVTGYGPIETGADAKACLPKEHLFPALLEKIRLILGENPAREPAEKTA